jgi:membrane protein YqaA with SNARE-associated domain
MEAFIDWLFELVALPKVGLPAVFLIALISATLLPLGSEPAVFGYVKLAPDMFWPCILVATAGNVIGGMIDWWMGHEARKAYVRYKWKHRHGRSAPDDAKPQKPKVSDAWFGRMRRYGPPALLLSWLPGVGDPLCAVAGWLRLRWMPCLMWMTVGKLARYIVMTSALLWIPDSFWRDLLSIFK